MDPIEYLRAVRRRWWVLAVAALVAVFAVLATTPSEPDGGRRKFRADHEIAPVPGSIFAGGTKKSTVENLRLAARVFRGPELSQRVAEEHGTEEDPQALSARVSVEVNKKAGRIVFSSTADDPDEAATLAESFAEEAIAFHHELEEQAYTDEVQRTASQIEELQSQMQKGEGPDAGDEPAPPPLRATRDALAGRLAAAIDHQANLAGRGEPEPRFATASSAVRAVSAKEDDKGLNAPSSRGWRLVLVLALALTLATALVLVVDRFDTRLRTRMAAEYAFGLPVLAEIPVLSRRRVSQEPEAIDPARPIAEGFHALRSALLLTSAMPLSPVLAGADYQDDGPFGEDTLPSADGGYSHQLAVEPSGPGRDVELILVTSAGEGEGKSTTVANLAASMAETDRSVLVIDCDLRHPTLERLLGVDQAPGVSDILIGSSTSVDPADLARPTRLPGVLLLTSGTPVANPAGLMPEARHLLEQCRGAADVIIVDTPPALIVNDAAELVPVADAVVTVARVGRTTVDAARQMSELLARLGAPTFGVVLIGVARKRAERRFSDRPRTARTTALTSVFRRPAVSDPRPAPPRAAFGVEEPDS